MARESALAKLPAAAKIGIVVGWLAVVGVVYFVVFYGDLASSIKAEQGREEQLHSDLSDARKAEFAYQKDLAELTDRQQRQGELNKVLPEEPQVASFLSSIQEVANVSGVSLVAWTPQEERPEEFYARVPMALELTGRYHQVAKFFYGVGQLDRIINMENISMTDPKQENDEIRVKVSVLATAFRILKESQGAKPGPAKPGEPAPAPQPTEPPKP
jgi:type IV pilus assembly protein PilO